MRLPLNLGFFMFNPWGEFSLFGLLGDALFRGGLYRRFSFEFVPDVFRDIADDVFHVSDALTRIIFFFSMGHRVR